MQTTTVYKYYIPYTLLCSLPSPLRVHCDCALYAAWWHSTHPWFMSVCPTCRPASYHLHSLVPWQSGGVWRLLLHLLGHILS